MSNGWTVPWMVYKQNLDFLLTLAQCRQILRISSDSLGFKNLLYRTVSNFLHPCLSSRRESHPVPGGFPHDVVLQCSEEVSNCGQTEADIRDDGESGKSGAAMLKVSSS